MGRLHYRYFKIPLKYKSLQKTITGIVFAICCVPIAVSFDAAVASDIMTCQFSGACLASVSADLDGDGKPDSAELVYDMRTSMFNLLISTANGNFYRPLAGPVDRRVELPSMNVRRGTGDLRCRQWSDGTVCGYPTLSDAPSTALYVTGGNGEFVIYITAPIVARSSKASGETQSKAYTVVVPALEGEAVEEMVGS